MGHPFEYITVTDVPGTSHFDLPTLEFHGEFNKFGCKRGQWTDDASMGLCMADSFILRQAFDGSDLRRRFWCWWFRGYNNAFRKDVERESKKSIGLGGNTQKSLEPLAECLDAGWQQGARSAEQNRMHPETLPKTSGSGERWALRRPNSDNMWKK